MADKKVMLMVAFTPNKRFSITAVPPKEHVDANFIIQFVRHTGDLWRCLRSKPIHLNDMLWQWDNARPHTARLVKDFLDFRCEARGITTVSQSPYSPDFNLCDRLLFRWMKAEFSKREFESRVALGQKPIGRRPSAGSPAACRPLPSCHRGPGRLRH